MHLPYGLVWPYRSCVLLWARRRRPRQSISSIQTGPSPCRTSGRWEASRDWPWIRTITCGCWIVPTTCVKLSSTRKSSSTDCCTRPPSMIHIDKEGNVIGYFDPPQGHGMAVDSKGFVYIGNVVGGKGNVRKYDPKTGKMLAELPRAPEMPPGGGGEGGGGGAPESAHRAKAAPVPAEHFLRSRPSHPMRQPWQPSAPSILRRRR